MAGQASRSSGPQGPDAVAAARLWLAEQGVTAVPDRSEVGGATPVGQAAGEVRSADRVATVLGPENEEDSETRAREIVLRKLGAQARTRHELQKALRSKDVSGEVGEKVLDRFERAGLIDDAAFAHDWVSSRQQRRRLSRRILRRELRDRGVAQDHIDSALAQVGPDDEHEVALQLAQRRYRSMAGLAPAMVRRRLAGVLGRRGFGPDLISHVLAEVLEAESNP